MSNGVEGPKLAPREIEKLAAERAREKVRTAKWDLGVAVFAYATLIAVVMLRLEGIAIEIAAAVAVFGLALVWFVGWRRGRQLFGRFYDEELNQLQEFSPKKAEVSIPSPLTRRELEILDYIARGYMNKQIANELGLSQQTIKNHLSSILRKLAVNDRTQAVVLAISNGWVSSPDTEPPESTTRDKIRGSVRL